MIPSKTHKNGEPPTIPNLSTRGNTTVWFPISHALRRAPSFLRVLKERCRPYVGKKNKTLFAHTQKTG